MLLMLVVLLVNYQMSETFLSMLYLQQKKMHLAKHYMMDHSDLKRIELMTLLKSLVEEDMPALLA